MYELFQQKTMTGQPKNDANALSWHIVNTSLAGKVHDTISSNQLFWNLKDPCLY